MPRDEQRSGPPETTRPGSPIGDTTGVLHIGVGHTPYLHNGSYKFTNFLQSHFSYPDEAERAAGEILREATLHDVYVCPT